MRLIMHVIAVLVGIVVIGFAAHDDVRAATPPRDPDDILGEIEVQSTARGRAEYGPRIDVAIDVRNVADPTAALLREIVARDLSLSGLVDVIAVSDESHDREAWRDRDVDAVIRLAGERGRGVVDLDATIVWTRGHRADVELSQRGPALRSRLVVHRLVDRLIGALTSHDGGFASQLTFVRTAHGARTVYVVDVDGYGLRAMSRPDELATAPTFDPDHAVVYAASIDHGAYRIHRAGAEPPVVIEPRGSVYGIAFDPTHERVAIAIAQGPKIQLFEGSSDLRDLKPRTRIDLALHPVFGPRGQLAYAGTIGQRQRIYIDARPVSHKQLHASAPDFCRNPKGTRLIYSLGGRKNADIVIASADGSDARRITSGGGRNTFPACSPDGRMIAFFASRGREGPGLYVMRSDGFAPKKVLGVLGDSLRWAAVPAAWTTIAEPAIDPSEVVTGTAYEALGLDGGPAVDRSFAGDRLRGIEGPRREQ